MHMTRIAAALSVAGAMSLASYGPAQSAPLTALSAAAKPIAEETSAVPVRFGGWGWGVGALAAGALIGAAIASPYYYGGYDPSYYGYGYPYYGYSAGYYPTYSYGYTTTYYPAYSYGYYRPYGRHYGWHRSYWRHSYAWHGGYRRW